MALGRFNYVILIKQYGFAVKSGIEQRDAAIKMGGSGATTLRFKDNKLHSQKEPCTAKLLVEKLNPQRWRCYYNKYSCRDIRIAFFAAKNAALLTLLNHEKHLWK